ncbi:unnamed protein product [Durusdinium trenchii]|uniref:PPIase cyclophilin-type domain-containing protein n=1 Tax=Durusdinium trenchii TaxID=1381693 RepID=A0ABP0SZK2_9DINO
MFGRSVPPPLNRCDATASGCRHPVVLRIVGGGDHPPALLATPPVAWAPQGRWALRDVKRHVVVETNGIVRRSSWAQPPSLKVKCHTTKGLLHLQLDPSKSPAGVRRFVDLVRDDFFRDQAIFRAVRGVRAQFGISALRETAAIANARWLS